MAFYAIGAASRLKSSGLSPWPSQEASGELALNEAGVSPPCETLSFAEFVQQFNLLHDWLHRLQSSMLDCDPERKSEMAAVSGHSARSHVLFIRCLVKRVSAHPVEFMGKRVCFVRV